MRAPDLGATRGQDSCVMAYMDAYSAVEAAGEATNDSLQAAEAALKAAGRRGGGFVEGVAEYPSRPASPLDEVHASMAGSYGYDHGHHHQVHRDDSPSPYHQKAKPHHRQPSSPPTYHGRAGGGRSAAYHGDELTYKLGAWRKLADSAYAGDAPSATVTVTVLAGNALPTAQPSWAVHTSQFMRAHDACMMT